MMNERNKAANRVALVAMLLGISGMMLSCIAIGGFIAIAGMIVSISAIRNTDCTKRGFAITGIVTSAIAMIVAILATLVFLTYVNLDSPIDVREKTNITYSDVTELK
jgi:heme/copper-type cytochrome/quinol oxidase subunit 2